MTFPVSSITTFNVYNGFPLLLVPIGLVNICSKIYPSLPAVLGPTTKLSPLNVLSIPSLISKPALKYDLFLYVELGPCLLSI